MRGGGEEGQCAGKCREGGEEGEGDHTIRARGALVGGRGSSTADAGMSTSCKQQSSCDQQP